MRWMVVTMQSKKWVKSEDVEKAHSSSLTAVRELKMIQFLNTATDKPNWQTKVWDEKITAKWRSEVPEEFMTTKMMDWVGFCSPQ